MTLKNAVKRIDPFTEYSLSRIAKEKLIPWIGSYNTAYLRVLEDKALPEGKQVLSATIVGEGKGRAILVTGHALIAYIKANRAKLKEIR